ncbi:MAG: 50S ribosomal protein L18 [Candidatus Pacebacteria bacterium]|nr:50S ribosomal protein L18 [Candidatus Paceibacterota bacterium]
MKQTKQQKRIRRHNRVRAKVKGTAKTPRLCVFRSNQHITAQIIDDEKGKTIVFATDKEKSKIKSARKSSASSVAGGSQKSEKELTGKIVLAFDVGKEIAKLAQEKKIKQVVFDRGGFNYHGRVKALADGAREGGLVF